MKARNRADAGIVDDDVQSASPLNRECHQRLEIGTNAHVSHLVGSLASEGCNVSNDLRQDVSATRAEHHCRTCFRAFTRRIGQAPFAYVRSWRMTRARAALAERYSSVSDVAASVGYTSQSAFGHAFRRTFGDAPRQHMA